METIKWAVNHMPKTEDANLKVMALDEIAKARAFHESFPQYSVTPLTKLDKMADFLGLGEVYIKDESYRFGLNAFKVLGGSFAMARYIAQQTGKDVSELPYNVLTSDQLREEFGQATFFTATDGNHGRGVAWAANKLGQKSVVLMPKGSTQTRLNNILAENAVATDRGSQLRRMCPHGKRHGDEDRERRYGSGYCLGGLRRDPGMDHAGIRNDGDGGERSASRVRMRQTDPCLYPGRRWFSCRSCSGILRKPLSGQSTESDRCGSRSRRLSLQRRSARRRQHPDRRRRYGHD